MNNKQSGNKYEEELATKLFENGFWVHRFAQNADGQPADIIAVRNGRPYLIDAKISATIKGFRLSRMESNQDTAMASWKNHRNGEGWFAIKLVDKTYMLTHTTIRDFASIAAYIPPAEIIKYGLEFDTWVKLCG